SVTFSGPQVVDVNNDDYGDSFRLSFGGDADEPTISVQRFEDGTWADYDPAVDYTEGASLSFGGVEVTLNGTPESGDQILVSQAGSEQREANLFRTMEEAIRVLDPPPGTSVDTDVQKADLRNTLNTSMRDLDNSLDNVLTVRASAGARLNELDVVDSVGSNRMLNYEQTLSDLVDLDYVEAISEYSLRQVGLQASQQAFVDIKGSTLFDYLR
ncbi:MAG: flagellar hook-associated protein FlgL, partial [Pseudomonadota bacterium]